MFAPNGDYRVYYPSNLLRNARSFENWGIFNNYYIDTSVLLGTKSLVDSIHRFIRDPSGVFPYVTFVSVVSFNDVTIPAFCFCLSLKFVGVSSKHLRVFLESLRQCSDIFGNFRKMFGNVRLAFGTILENLRKSSEGGGKSSENQKRRHQHVSIIKRTLQGGLKI